MINDVAAVVGGDGACDDKSCGTSRSRGERREDCILRFLPGSSP